jgi:hypothetical protein
MFSRWTMEFNQLNCRALRRMFDPANHSALTRISSMKRASFSRKRSRLISAVAPKIAWASTLAPCPLSAILLSLLREPAHALGVMLLFFMPIVTERQMDNSLISLHF